MKKYILNQRIAVCLSTTDLFITATNDYYIGWYICRYNCSIKTRIIQTKKNIILLIIRLISAYLRSVSVIIHTLILYNCVRFFSVCFTFYNYV